MVKHSLVELVPLTTPGQDNVPFDLNLPQRGGISWIEVYVKATNGAGGCSTPAILSALQSIRLTNGSTMIFDLSSSELYNLAYLRDGKKPMSSVPTGAGAVQEVRIPIMFGKNRQDELMGIDLQKLQGAKLTITPNITISGADGYATKSLQVRVIASTTQNEAVPGYQGFLRPVKALGDTLTTIGSRDLQLPFTQGLVFMALYAYLNGTTDGALVDKIEMRDSKEAVMIRGNWTDTQYTHTLNDGTINAYWNVLYESRDLNGDISLAGAIQDTTMMIKTNELVAAGLMKVLGLQIAKQ